MIFVDDLLDMKIHNKINRSKISAAMTKILLTHESGLIMAEKPEQHSLLQNKVQKPSPMLCLNEVENLHNYKQKYF